MIFLRWTRGTVVSGLRCSFAWLIANVLLICFGGKNFERFLMDLPDYLVMGIVCVSGILYLIDTLLEKVSLSDVPGIEVIMAGVIAVVGVVVNMVNYKNVKTV